MPPHTAARNDYVNANEAVGILTACAQDVGALEESVPESKKTAGFRRAIASLRERIAVGREMQEARREW